MPDEFDTPALGTEDATPDQADTASEWDYYDPDEDDQDNVDNPKDEATDDGTQEVEDEDPDEVDEADLDEDQDEDGDEADKAASEQIELANGEKVTRDELVKGYLRQNDYTRKTTELAERRKFVQAESQRINTITESFIDFIVNNTPPEPDVRLAQTDPQSYVAQKAAYDATLNQVQQLIQASQATKQSAHSMSEDQLREIRAVENAKLVERFPQTGTADGRRKFFEFAASAAKDLGYSDAEIGNTMDSRMFALAHYAGIGLRAEKSRAKAKEKVKSVPATPSRPAGKRDTGRNRAAERFAKTRSIHDAVAAWDGES